MASRRHCNTLGPEKHSARPHSSSRRKHSTIAFACVLLAGFHGLNSPRIAAETPPSLSPQAAAPKADTKPAGSALVQLVSAEKSPAGSWRAELDSGRSSGLLEGAQGLFYRFTPREKQGGNSTLQKAGQGKLIALTGLSATAEISLDPGVTESPKPGDFIYLPVTVPGNTFEGSILDLAKLRILLTSPDRSQAFTNLPAARALHSDADEKAILEKLAAAIRSTPAKSSGIPDQAESISRGVFRGKLLSSVLQNCTADDVADLLRFLAVYPGGFLGNDYPVQEIFSRWILMGAPETRDVVERRARGFRSDSELAEYLKDVQERQHLVLTSLYAWADAARNAANDGDVPALQFYARLLRGAGVATNTPAFSVAAQIGEALLLSHQNNLKEAIAKIQEAAALADTLPDDPSYDRAEDPRDDITRAYWKSQSLFELALLQARIPDYNLAIATFDDALKLLSGHAHSRTRALWESLLFYREAEVYRKAGKLDRARDQFLRARDAFSRRDSSSAHDYEVLCLAQLAEIATPLKDYKLSIARYTEAVDLARKYELGGRALDYTWSLGLAHWYANEYEKAIVRYQELLPVYKQRGDTENTCNLLQNIGHLWVALGKFDSAIDSFAEGRRLAESHQLYDRAALFDLHEAGVLSRQGRYPEAAKLLDRAVSRLDPKKDGKTLAEIYSASAEMFAKWKQTGKAEENYKLAASTYAKLGLQSAQDEQLSALADLYRQSGNSASAASVLEEVIGHQRAAAGAPLARSLTRLAFVFLNSAGGLPKALTASNEAFDVAVSSGDMEAILGAREARAAYYSTVGDESKARAEYQGAIKEAQAHNDGYRVAWYTWRLGIIAAGLEDVALAAQSYDSALTYFKAQKLTYWAAQVLLSYGYLQVWQGDLAAARSSLKDSREIGGDSNAGLQAEQFMLEGRISRGEEDNQDSIAALRRADAIYKEASNPAGRLGVLMELGGIQHDQREMDDARKTWEQAIELSRDNPYLHTLAWGNLSLSLLRLGQFEEAAAAAKKSIELADSLPDIPYLAAELRGAWAVHLLEEARKIDDLSAAARTVDDATRFLNEADVLARKHALQRSILRVLFGQGRRLLLLADREGIAGLVQVQPTPPPSGEPNPLDGTIERANKLHLLEYQWEGLYHRGALCAHSGDFACASRDLEASLTFLEKQATQYAALASAAGASRYQADKQRPFLVLLKLYQSRSVEREKAAANAARKGFNDDAAVARKEAQDATAHARNILDRLRRYEMQTASPGIKLSAAAGQQGLVVTAYRNLIRQEKELERRLEEENKHVPPRAGVIKTIEDELTQKRTQVDKEAQLIREQFPEVARDLELDPENPDAFVKALREDEALVEPVLTADRLIIFVARNRQEEISVWSFTAEVDPKKFESDLTALWKAAADPNSSFDPAQSNEPGTPAHVAAELFDWLFASAELRLDGVKTVLLSATGPLRYVPFHILLAPGPDGRRVYLNDRYDIVYLTRKGIASGYAPGTKYRGAAVVAVANPSKEEPLPEADAEVDAMAEIWKGSPFEPRHHDAATAIAVSALLQRMKIQTPNSQRILHIATHGSAGALPQDSFLLFADGKVSQDELREKLGLPRAGISLAVLSGCETAYSSNAQDPGALEGLGVTGLAYGFENAGVKTVIGTLWKLDSATGPIFMQGFYRRLSEGSSVAEALSRTREELRNSKPHPYYWAPFIVVGQWR